MNREELTIYLGESWSKVNSYIRESLSSDIELLNKTNESLLSHPGKQLRPALSLLVSDLCSNGNINDSSCRFAAASELLHNATLMHDDVADNSSTRRGRPTVMSMLGPQAAVLLGDFWLVKAMDVILGAENGGNEVIRIFAKTLSDLAEGEMLQLQKAGTADTTEKDYFRIIYCKTASLFEASALSAACSVCASKEQEAAVRNYAVNLGLAFQVKDDIMDYQDSPELGKPVGQDLMEQKITMPLLGALRNISDENAKAVRRKVSEILDHPEYCEQVRDVVMKCGGVEYAQNVLSELIDKAKSSLDMFPETKAKRILMDLADYTSMRKS